jgi:hypothetical protein
MKLSSLQMTDATSWKGLTTENHLGAIWQEMPQKASDYISTIQQKYFGNDIEGFLDRYETKEFENDTDYTWELMSKGVDNIALVEARVDGTAVTAASEAGKNFTEFELVFGKDWFSVTEKIVGEKNEKYPIRIKSQYSEGTNTVYVCELLSGDPLLFVPYEELVAGKLFSREYAPVSRTMSVTGRDIKFKSHISMRNAFSQIRIKKKTPGNLSGRKMGTFIKDDSGNIHKMWQHYESFMMDNEFRQDINRLLMFGTANRTVDGNYVQKDVSGYSVVEGSGLREQTETANTSFYSTFDIDDLASRLMDLSEAKLGMDERAFLMCTGERGAWQFHKAMEDYVQLFTPLRNTDRMYKVSKDGIKMGMGYGGQFVEFQSFNGIVVNLSIMGMYDDRSRNKQIHPLGGVTESYRYDIFDIGTNDGEANIRKTKVKGSTVIHKYIPGLRNPFDPDGKVSAIGTAEDAWEEHKFWQGGIMVKDPSRTASFIYNAA